VEVLLADHEVHLAFPKHFLKIPIDERYALGETDLIAKLLVTLADPSVSTKLGYSALWHTADGGHAGSVAVLLAHCNGKCYARGNATPLMKPVQRGHTAVVNLPLAGQEESCGLQG